MDYAAIQKAIEDAVEDAGFGVPVQSVTVTGQFAPERPPLSRAVIGHGIEHPDGTFEFWTCDEDADHQAADHSV